MIRVRMVIIAIMIVALIAIIVHVSPIQMIFLATLWICTVIDDGVDNIINEIRRGRK